MKKLIISIFILLLISTSLSYSVSNDEMHIYHKYTVKTWWDKNNNNGLYDKEPIFSNKLERFLGTFSGMSFFDRSYTYRYTDYKIVEENKRGYISYTIEGTNVKKIDSTGDRYYEIINLDNRHIFYLCEVKDIRKDYYGYKPWTHEYKVVESYRLKLDYYIYEHKDKDVFLDTVTAPKNTYPDNGIHADGYWYVDIGPVNKDPGININQPIANHRFGNQDRLYIDGSIRDVDIGDTINIKYSIESITNSNVSLTQPTTLISNGQDQSFEGYIKLNGIDSGNKTLKIWAEDDKGGKSEVIEVPITVFNTLENILDSLKNYVYKSGEPQILIVNSNTTITQSQENDRLIEEIRQELERKNVKLFFIGLDGETENYIRAKLLY